MAHDSTSKLGSPSVPLVESDHELGELNHSQINTSDGDNEDDYFLPRTTQPMNIGSSWPSWAQSGNKRALFWIAVNIVATVLIVSYTHSL